jgi:hypothetical protein
MGAKLLISTITAAAAFLVVAASALADYQWPV